MADEKKDDFRTDRFTWKKGEVKFITPDENAKLKEQENKKDNK